ncbi:MAG: nodulation protein NfeD [Deltaproteobacteria bacterium]|jgi:membrane-bound serine protease (ClpP class)|nr:nodulation protein NfeD [Deltaproteobacteria bacterium]
MKRLISIVSFFLILGGIAGICIGSQSPDNRAYRIVLDDDIINPVSAEYIISSIEKAEEEDASFLIIELDTPGGLLSSTRKIVKRIMNAKVPIIVYVAPKGARAGSAGVFITLAANVAAMAPSTNIGAAHPVQMSDRKGSSDILSEMLRKIRTEKDVKDQKKPGAPMDDKILNDTKAWVQGIARDRGRNANWAIDAVVKSVSVTDSQALKLNVIDLVASDLPDLIKKLNGREISFHDEKFVFKTDDVKIVEIPKNFRLKWLAILAHPNIAYILLMLGFYGLLFEFTHPGIGFPGVAGAVCLVLAFFGLQVLPTNYAGVALIVLGITMLIAEIKVTSYGLLTIGGLGTLFLGSLILFSTPYEFMRVSLPIIYSFVGSTLIIALFLIFIISKNRRRRPATGSDGMIGTTGEVLNWNKNSGKVMVHGEIWNAMSDVELHEGDKIEVSIVNGMTLLVTTKKEA